MTIAVSTSFHPLPNRRAATIELTSRMVRIIRRRSPATCLWGVTHGGSLTGSLHITGAAPSNEAFLSGWEQLMAEPDVRQLLADYADGEELHASPIENNLGVYLPGCDTPFPPQGDSPRAGIVYMSSTHPEMFEAAASVHVLSERYRLHHNSALFMVTGRGPAFVRASHLAPSMAALGESLDGFGADPDWLTLNARFGHHRLGMAIYREILVD